MCPDKQLLSAFCDGEVPSPWKEKIERHLDECGSCRRVVSVYESMRESLREFRPQPDISAARYRVGERLKSVHPAGPFWWRRRVSFSAAIAAAALAFLLGGGAGFQLISRIPGGAGPAVAAQKPLDITVNVKDIGQLLEILNRQNSIREVTIQLPETPRFEYLGEPVFLRETEYSRGSGK